MKADTVAAAFDFCAMQKGKPMSSRIALVCLAAGSILLNACTRPLLVEGTGLSAPTEIGNGSSGYVQVMTFEDPQTCAEPRLIGYVLKPGQRRSHVLPGGKVITIAIGAFGLPAAPGHIAWCESFFFSTRLLPGRNYRLEFETDVPTKTCFARLIDKESGQSVPTLRREGRMSGAVVVTYSCTPTPALDGL